MPGAMLDVIMWASFLATAARASAVTATMDLAQVSDRGTDTHVPFGKKKALITVDHLISRDEDGSGDELDISEWTIDIYSLHAYPKTRAPRSPLLEPLRTRLRVKPPTGHVDEKQVGLADEEARPIDPSALESVTHPVVPSEIWSELTGREFEMQEAVEKFTCSGLQIAKAPSNEWVQWRPVDKTTSQAEERGNHRVALEADEILVYSGKWRKQGHGSHLPIIKTQSIVDMSAKDMAELLLDSSRVKTYNKMSLGRKDVRVMQLGVDTQGSFGHGETKIVRNLTQPPISKKQMLAVTMMHGRKLRPEDGIEGGGYIVVSRAVPYRSEESESYAKSEILLGVNIIQHLKEPDQCLVTAVTHVYAPALPTIVASRVGVSSAINFVNDIRKVCRPRITA